MKLKYHLSNNFGDALNPYIFKRFLPDFFDNDEEVILVGIGSILGFQTIQSAKKKIVFSSGFAYGTLPIIGNSYDIKCVRGPLTCEALNIDKKYAITDGAVLLQFMDETLPSSQEQPSKISFIPHWESSLKFNWESICNSVNVNYINPTDSYENIIAQIRNSQLIIAEAMHGAIVADTLRVPWIPVKAYKGINEFKWADWAKSVDVPYKPIKIPSLYNDTTFTRKIIKQKTGYPFSRGSLSSLLKIYESSQSVFRLDKVRSLFQMLGESQAYLSDDKIIKLRGEQLLDKLEEIKNQYHR